MTISRRGLLTATAATAAATTLPRTRARAQGKPVIKVGCLTDMSGPYRDIAGGVAVSCTKLAGADFGVAGHDFDFEVVSADHQNKPDLGASIARQWFDRDGVDLIVE